MKTLLATFALSLWIGCLTAPITSADDIDAKPDSKWGERNGKRQGAGDPNAPRRGDGRQAQGDRPQFGRRAAGRDSGQGFRRQNAEGGGQPRRFGAQGMGGGDPARIATMMMSRFDQNGDEKLNVDELAAMFKTLRERRGSAGFQNERKKGQPENMREGGDGQPRRGLQRGNRNQDVTPGGVIPQRPPSAG